MAPVTVHVCVAILLQVLRNPLTVLARPPSTYVLPVVSQRARLSKETVTRKPNHYYLAVILICTGTPTSRDLHF